MTLTTLKVIDHLFCRVSLHLHLSDVSSWLTQVKHLQQEYPRSDACSHSIPSGGTGCHLVPLLVMFTLVTWSKMVSSRFLHCRVLFAIAHLSSSLSVFFFSLSLPLCLPSFYYYWLMDFYFVWWVIVCFHHFFCCPQLFPWDQISAGWFFCPSDMLFILQVLLWFLA